MKKVIFLIFGIFLILSLRVIVAECGDGACDSGEDVSCPDDCLELPGGEGTCGDLNCDVGEEDYCPKDCGGEELVYEKSNQDKVFSLCGNTICEEGEDELTCPEDCIVGDKTTSINLNNSNPEQNITNQTSQTTENIEAANQKSSIWIFVLIIVIILIIIGVIVFIIWKKSKETEEIPEQNINQMQDANQNQEVNSQL